MNKTQTPAQAELIEWERVDGIVSAQADLIELERRARAGEYVTPGALWAAREEAALEAFERAPIIQIPNCLPG